MIEVIEGFGNGVKKTAVHTQRPTGNYGRCKQCQRHVPNFQRRTWEGDVLATIDSA